MEKIGVEVARNMIITRMEQFDELIERIGVPAVVRPSFTLGGIGGGIAYSAEQLKAQLKKGLTASELLR